MNIIENYEFPIGLKILLVDYDRTCLVVMETMLRKLSYKVTKCRRAKDALALLREDRTRFDIVICDLHMPDIDGLKFSEIIDLEMDLPVVMISSDDRQEVVMKGIIKGACDYMIKPVPLESLRFIWQHVVRKKRKKLQQLGFGNGVNLDVKELLEHTNDVAADNQMTSTVDKSSMQCSKQKIEAASNDGESSDDATTARKPRVVWSQELHELFVAAVDKLGRDKAVPKKILELMQAMDATASCLTRANIASHLQKYRMHIQKGVARSNGTYHRNLQFHPPSLNNSYQLPLQNHVDQRNNFFDSNIVSESNHCIRNDVSMYELSRSNLLYQNDFPPRGDYVVVSNEENSYGNVENGTELFSGPSDLLYEPSSFVEYVQDFIQGPF